MNEKKKKKKKRKKKGKKEEARQALLIRRNSRSAVRNLSWDRYRDVDTRPIRMAREIECDETGRPDRGWFREEGRERGGWNTVNERVTEIGRAAGL